jgi:glycosyltransferase involved in cell wall biosynthesis
VFFTDDCSSDNTFDIVQDACKDVSNVKLVKNTNRKGAMQNLYNMISECSPDEIVLTLDGDDWFPNGNVLPRLEVEYSSGAWMTYGQYLSVSNGNPGPSKLLPPSVIQNSSFRKYNWCTSHLRTFYAGLFHKIKIQDLKGKDGEFYPMAWDLGMMFPMLEMSGPRSRFISDILYMYNDTSPMNDFKTNAALQLQLDEEIRNKAQYSLLDNL